MENHPGWLMILDNVDDGKAAAAVEKLLARLRGGQVIITGRSANFSAAVRKLELGVLDSDAASAFLLERTQDDRDRSANDATLARDLATELGGLALGLEERAGAYIAAERIGFARYLALWREKRETVLNWFDKALMSYDHDTGLAASGRPLSNGCRRKAAVFSIASLFSRRSQFPMRCSMLQFPARLRISMCTRRAPISSPFHLPRGRVRRTAKCRRLGLRSGPGWCRISPSGACRKSIGKRR